MKSVLETLQASFCPDEQQIVIRDSVSAWTWTTFRTAIRDLAAALTEQNVERLGLWGDNSVAWVLADLACQEAGIVCIPLPGFFSGEQLQHVLKASSLDSICLATDHSLPAFLAGTAPETLTLGECHKLLRLRRNSSVTPLPAGTTKITFTSGSTGHPKGVCLSTEQQIQTALALKDRVQGAGLEKHLCTLPLVTLLENIAGIYLPLFLGACIEVRPLSSMGFTGSSQLNVQQWTSAIRSIRPHSMILVPELARVLVEARRAEPALATNSFRFLAVGGAPVSDSLLAMAEDAGLPMYQGYGLSECGSVVSLNAPGNHKPGTAGQSLSHVRLRLDANGELQVKGSAFLGYLGEPAPAGTQAPTEIATGDLASIDESGFLTVYGRSKNLIITGYGRNVSPEWLESEITAKIAGCQALVFQSEAGSLHTIIWPTERLCKAAVRESLSELNGRLPDYARLKKAHVLDRPLSRPSDYLTANGRLRRQNLLRDLNTLLSGKTNTLIDLPGEKPMPFFDTLIEQTEEARQEMLAAPVVAAIPEGRMPLEGYQYFLSQAFHHVKHTAPLMMAAGGRLSEKLEFVREALVEYIEEEYGHHEWILNDLRACGADPESTRSSQADTPVELMVSYLYHQVDRGNPLALFGMVLVLEGTSVNLATPLGQHIQKNLDLPDAAFSYLYSHGELDQSHFEFFKNLMNRIESPEDQTAIIRSARMCYQLYGDMLRTIPLSPVQEVKNEAA